MLPEWIAVFQKEFATAAAYAAAVIFISTIPFCIFKRRWPEVAHLVMMLLIGGFATLVLSLREATANWRKVTNF
jgi:uncharacterized membrane protein YczE